MKIRETLFIVIFTIFTRLCLSLAVEYNLVEGLGNVYITEDSEDIGLTWKNGNIHDKGLIQKFYTYLASYAIDSFTVIDVGAQTGCFSLLAKYFPHSQWYAFEPLQEAADNLQKNLSLNDITNVSIYQMAASKTNRLELLSIPEKRLWGLSTLGNPLRFDTSVEKREVECVDLDSFVKKNAIEKVHFMKIDTEGWELHVLEGARNLLLRDHPIILMEYNKVNMQQCNVKQDQVDALLRELGYSWSFLGGEDILCVPADQ